MGMQKHAGPAESEKALFQLWDEITAIRAKHGERVAAQLATKALQAIEPSNKPQEAK